MSPARSEAGTSYRDPDVHQTDAASKEVIAALILGGLELEFNLGNNLLVKNSAPTATFKLHSMDVKFCPFCGKSAKLLAPRTQWISKDGEKTRL